jgi:hypothetical protein
MDLKELAMNSKGTGRHPWEVARVEAVIHRLKQRKAPLISILDFGCGDLYVAARLVEAFPSLLVYAVDSEHNPASFPGGKTLNSRIQVFRSLEEAEQSAGATKMSAVLLLDVLEHCENDSVVLNELRCSPLVDSRTQFLITVPAFQWFYSRYDRFLGHFRRYTLAQLSASVRGGGLQVHAGHYFFASLLLPRALVVLAERFKLLKAPPKGLANYKARPWIDEIARRVLRMDFRFCQRLSLAKIYSPGLSVLVEASPIS